jgi:hypothetical protein
MGLRFMRAKLVTCPGTAKTELIEYLDTPLGMLVVSCTRSAGAVLHCQRLCVELPDRARRCSSERLVSIRV